MRKFAVVRRLRPKRSIRDSHAPPPSPSDFEEEPGIDQAAFATGLREVLRVWAIPEDRAPLLDSLIQAIFGGFDSVWKIKFRVRPRHRRGVVPVAASARWREAR